ncbi:DNA/RNA polymerases superfamily protein [Gossypium australe]|uniref:DNA/RNA polymerases superfamily protein n=1 Tax=Gossypium australe TaxID=47621 RepID=A0A5B6UXC7_9ROSI|nr:DNA/RNA polymerases superfamily protein [Gossypium australe]
MSHFWTSMYEALGTRLIFSIAYRTQFDGQSESNCEEHLPLVEFAYNNNSQSSIQMASYEALYGHKCRKPLCWIDLGEKEVLGPNLVHETVNNVKIIRDQLEAASDPQKSYSNLKMRDIEYNIGDQVFLKVSPWKRVLRLNNKGKLSPKFIGLYCIIRRLELPPELDCIHDVFHVSMLRHYRSNPSHVIPIEDIEVRSDLTFEEEPILIINRDVKVLRRKQVLLVKVL